MAKINEAQAKTLNSKKIAKALGAKHCGSVVVKSGYFGAVQFAAEFSEKFQK